MKKCNSEHIEQVKFVEWLNAKKIKHTAIPNSFFTSRKNYGMINKFKKEGWNKGFPDMILIVPHGGKKVTVFIELKRADMKPKRGGSGGVSEEQEKWLKALNSCEWTVAYVAYGCDHAIRIVEGIIRG